MYLFSGEVLGIKFKTKMQLNKDTISFSIVTVVFNGFNEIERTIESCVGQDYTNYEYIIIDGKSTDGTTDIINKYLNKIDVFICEPDNGIFDAMNKGIFSANGDFLLFMNCGDCFYDNKVLANVVEKLKNIDCLPDVIYGNTLFKFKDGNLKVKPLPLDMIAREMVFCHQSSFFKTELLKLIPFDLKYKHAADYNMVYKYYYSKRHFCYLDIFIAVFNQLDGNTIRNYKRSTIERFSIHDDYGSLKNCFLKNKTIFRIWLGLFVKKCTPSKLESFIFRRKYKNTLLK